MKAGWINMRGRWHYFDLQKREPETFGEIDRKVSLCGQLFVYSAHDTETRHITAAGNCLTCARILRRKEAV